MILAKQSMEMFHQKIKSQWANGLPIQLERSLRQSVNLVEKEVKINLNGRVLNKRTGKTANAVKKIVENGINGPSARVFIPFKNRGWIVNIHEVGTSFLRKRDIMASAYERQRAQVMQLVRQGIRRAFTGGR